uniref:Uncharacterized protein n=1 Tax=Avena sativa TaxID=4498 RepID=A0ACD6A4A9_AVESA
MFWAVIFFLQRSTSLQLLAGSAAEPAGVGGVTFLAQLNNTSTGHLQGDRCAGRYVYMYDLPPRFNADLVRDCRNLSAFPDVCRHVTNDGFGPSITGGGEGGSLPEKGAYNTNQFMLALIFHARMKRHECLTSDPAAAAAVYVPFYAGLDVVRHQDQEIPANLSAREALPRGLVEWLLRRPEWRAMGGRDHFLVTGRGSWDFLRALGAAGKGNSLLSYPAIRNATVLTTEASPYHGHDFAVPFPSHFHASSDADVSGWQDRMRRAERKWLWGFAGASRPSSKRTVRSQIMEECGRSSRCAMVGSSTTAAAAFTAGPGRTMQLLESAAFCVQPRGDGYKRKSTFDSILAGCIPVFFHPISAYIQYIWHLPRDYRTYSVFIHHGDVVGKNASIEEALARIPPAKVARMREEVIRLIPTVMYRDPAAAKGVTFKDAFDVAVDAVIHRVAKRRRAAAEGRVDYQDSVDGGKSWKYDLLQDGEKNIGPHEFDPYVYT